jgi:hypothetical protein
MTGHGPRPRTRGGDAALAVALFALLFSLYLLTFSGIYHASDEMSMLAVTDSLARRGAWDIELLRWMGEQQGSYGPDGHLYGRKGIGTTLAALPLYWLALQVEGWGNVQAAMLTNGVVTALTGVLVYLLLRRLRYGPGAALGTALAFGLATMAWPYARYLFSESLAGLGLVSSFYFLVCYGTLPLSPARPEARGAERGLWLYPLLAGTGLALALLARLNNAIVAPLLGALLLYYLYRRHGRGWRAWLGPLVLFTLPLLFALAIAAWYNWLRFGSLLTTGYLPQERFDTPFLEGFYGLTLSPGKGLFWYNPVLFAALVAWPAFFRRGRAEALLAASVLLANVAFYAPWFLWWAGHGWGPRFLVTVLPFAALPLAPAIEAAGRRRAVALGLGALILISLVVQLLGVAVDFNLYLEDIYAELGLYHPATLFDWAYSPLLRQLAYLDAQRLDLAWARHGAIDGVALLAGLGLVLASALALGLAWRNQRPTKSTVARMAAWLGVPLLLLLLLGTGLSLARYGPGGHVALAAVDLVAMEDPREVAALTDPLLTEPFQDAYDGSLWVWGVPSSEDVWVENEGLWAAGAGDPAAAAAHFQTGPLRLDLFPASGQEFDLARLPVPPLEMPLNLGDALALVAFRLDETAVRRGGMLPVTLYWRALAPMPVSYTVSVQVIDEDGIKAGQVDRLPCNGGCPTTTWRPGDVTGEYYELAIDPGAPPGRYRLAVGMYDLATGQRLPHLDARGNVVGDLLPLGTIAVQP